MNKRIVWFSLLCLSLLGCSKASEEPPAAASAEPSAPRQTVQTADKAAPASPAMEAKASLAAEGEAPPAGGAPVLSPIPKSATAPKLIKNGAIHMRVEKYKEARAALSRIVAAQQAYIAKEEEKAVDNVMSNVLVLRVATERFDALLDAVAALGAHVQSRTVNVTDVTEEYVDLEARLKAKRAVEARYQEVLKQSRTIRETLDVEQCLRQVQEEIEVAEGRRRYLDNQVSLSTIEVTMFEQPPGGPRTDPGVPGFFARLWDAVGHGWTSLMRLAIDMAEEWPAWLLFFAAVWLAWKLVRKGLAAHARRRESRPAYWPAPPPAPWAPPCPPGPPPAPPSGGAEPPPAQP